MHEKPNRMLTREGTKAIHKVAMIALGLSEDNLLPQNMRETLLKSKQLERDDMIEEQARGLIEKVGALGLSNSELTRKLWCVAGGLWTYGAEEREKRHDGNYQSIHDLRSDVVQQAIVQLRNH